MKEKEQRPREEIEFGPDYNDLKESLLERLFFLPYDTYHWLLHALKKKIRQTPVNHS